MYIHQSFCISAQHTFFEIDLEIIVACKNNMLKTIEPKYEGIPLGNLRRMGKAVRIGVGCALPLINETKKINGIIIGTANGGMEDCIKFLSQIIHFEEGTLTPTNFVQSTPNAIAAQIGILSNNNEYNMTHVHRGLAFENALLDTMMLLNENPNSHYLLGGLDEISDYNYNIEYLANWYKKESITNDTLYESKTTGSIAGEGASMFLVSNQKEGAIANVADISTIHSTNPAEVSIWISNFLKKNEQNIESIDLLISGENGDCRLDNYYENIEKAIPVSAGIVRYKHFSGEYPTSSAFALWLSLQFIVNKKIPKHFEKRPISNENNIHTVLIYNAFKGSQHSLVFLKSNQSTL